MPSNTAFYPQMETVGIQTAYSVIISKTRQRQDGTKSITLKVKRHKRKTPLSRNFAWNLQHSFFPEVFRLLFVAREVNGIGIRFWGFIWDW
jgi:hypothetical protein